MNFDSNDILTLDEEVGIHFKFIKIRFVPRRICEYIMSHCGVRIEAIPKCFLTIDINHCAIIDEQLEEEALDQI